MVKFYRGDLFLQPMYFAVYESIHVSKAVLFRINLGELIKYFISSFDLRLDMNI